ncbi:flagellin [Microvirga makkahensis]|uniref:Flagellin n=1 Tax=Microvirga makkahensis TaxID=1128670 RepID=A0A7X3SNY2_9HYPH|nr:flagellin [Microvirga makkahensis]MXQ11690.1 flagellin [Microvirga makkahensis]
MSSINTNLSAMTALQALKATQNAMNKNQNEISTGLRVSEASHNASYWSIATTMKSDKGALSAVKDSIGQSKSMINTFTSALDKTLTYLNKMKEGLVAARQPGADLDKIQGEFDAHIEGMRSAAASATFNGQNWLQTEGGNVELVTSYDGKSNKVNTLTINTDDTQLIGLAAGGTTADETVGILADVLTVDLATAKTAGTDATAGTADDGVDTAIIDGFLEDIDTAISNVTKASAMLGANKALLETQEEFIGVLSDSLTAGVSTFIDADMNEASTRNQALQTQQQLGVQALSMANQNSQMILKLFQ